MTSRERADHIERAIQSTDAWLAQNGLQKSGIPEEMRPHATESFAARLSYVALQKRRRRTVDRRRIGLLPRDWIR